MIWETTSGHEFRHSSKTKRLDKPPGLNKSLIKDCIINLRILKTIFSYCTVFSLALIKHFPTCPTIKIRYSIFKTYLFPGPFSYLLSENFQGRTWKCEC